MSEHNRKPRSSLAAARQELQEAQARIAELEVQLASAQPRPVDAFQNALDAAKLRHFIERTPAAVAIFDQDMRYLAVSERWITDYHLGDQPIIGRSHYEVFPDLPERWKEIHRRCLAGAVERCDADPFPRADGSLDWVRWEIHPWRRPEGAVGGIVILSEVITERKSAEDRALKLNRALSVLSDVNQAIVRIRDLPTLFETICRIAVEKGEFRLAWIGLLDPISRRVKSAAQAGLSDGTPEDHWLPLGADLHGRSASARALRAGNHVVYNDLAHDAAAIRWRAGALRLSCASGAVFPLTVAGKVCGTLNLYASEPEFFDSEGLRLLDEMAGDIAFAMEFARQEQQRQQAQAESQRLAEALEQHAALLEQRIAERTRELQTAKDRVEAILNNSGDGILLVTPAMRIRQTNSAFNRLFACDPDDYFDQPLSSLVHGSDADSLIRLDALRTEQQLEFRALRRDGSAFEAELSVGAVGTEGLVCTIRNITERKAQERQLRYYASVQEGVADAVMTMDMQYHVLSWNQAAERLYGWTAEEVIGKNVLYNVLRAPQEAEPERRQILQSFLERGNSEAEIVRLRKDGTEVNVLASMTVLKDERGVPIGMVAVHHDISERKRAEAARDQRAAEEREFQSYLMALQEITIELTQIDDLDSFYRRAVELGLERLGFERLALFLYDAESSTAIGTYGTDADGNVSDEHQVRFVPSAAGIMKRAYDRGERFAYEEQVPLTTALVPTGKGWNAAAVLWNGQQSLGWLAADNGLRHRPASGPLLDILSLFALTLGSLLARKQTTAALEQSEARYRLLAHNVSDVLVKIDSEGVQTFITPSCFILLGYMPEEMIGHSGFEFMHPDDSPATQRALQDAIMSAQTSFTFTARIRHKAGHYVWVEVTNNIVRAPDTGASVEIIAVIRDITRRREAEAALRESEARYRQLFEHNVAIKLIVDRETGAIFDANPAACEFYGYDLDRLKTMRISDINTLPAETVAAELSRAWKQTRTVFQFRHRLASGEIRDVEVYSGPVEIQGREMLYSIIMDVTERKRTEQALRESEEKFRLLLDLAPVPIVITDQAGAITLLNLQAEALFGYDRTELTGQLVEVLVPESRRMDHVRQRESYIEMPHMRSLSAATELYGRRKDGRVFPVEIQLGYVRTTSDFLVMAFVVDITTRKQAEAALLEALQKERELGELKSRFVSMASHEFRTPLATILALTETLSAYWRKLPEDQIEQRLDKIKGQVGYLKDIMEDVLLLARMQARRVDFDPVKLDIDALCRSVIDEFHDHPGVADRLTYSYEGQLREVRMDRKLMRQVISNLVSNAIKYSPDGKPVSIHLTSVAEAVTLIVRDEGIGIPEADLKHMFEPFHRAANVGTISGTGLGLVITKESVDLHGGSISIDSHVGAGTTITVSIPTTAEVKTVTPVEGR